jgi:hypothetical protein
MQTPLLLPALLAMLAVLAMLGLGGARPADAALSPAQLAAVAAPRPLFAPAPPVVQQQQQQPARAPWGADEDELLLQMFADGRSVAEIALALGEELGVWRSVPAVRMRLHRLRAARG